MDTNSQTLNNYGSGNWYLNIPGYYELEVKLTKFEIPEVTAGVTALGTRSEFIIQTTGDHIQYENLELEFLVDENLKNYIRLYQWMRENVISNVEESTSIFVHFLGNDKRFQGVEVEFLEAFPISLSKLSLDSNGTDTDVTCSVTFAYTGFDFCEVTNRN